MTFGKKYDPTGEQSLYQQRNEAGLNNPETVSQMQQSVAGEFPGRGEKMIISFPPPNVTGVLHLGHALTTSIEDMIVRYHRMRGAHALFLPGTDHAGIATQAKVEQKLFKEGIKRADLTRVEFLSHVWKFALENRKIILGQASATGASFDWSRESFTLSEKFCRGVRKFFKMMYDQGKIYRGSRVTNRDPEIQSVISDIEVNYETRPGKLYYIKYFTKGGAHCITVATTRPETLFADVAIAVHPGDKRYKELIGKTVLVPIVNRHIPVITDDYVDPSFGTGALKITPAHDVNDYEVGVRHLLPLDQIAIDKQNHFTDICGPDFSGLEVKKFYDNLIEALHSKGNLERTEDYEISTPISDRTGAVVQPLITQQWFYDVSTAAQASIQAVKNGETTIYPERFNQTFEQWMSNIRPWCVSRQLWWGHRIPVWYAPDGTTYCFDEAVIEENVTGNKILSQIIFNLIADTKLESTFTFDKLLEVLESSCIIDHDGKVYEVYYNIYHAKYSGDIDAQSQNSALNELIIAAIAGKSEAVDTLRQELAGISLIKRVEEGYCFDVAIVAGVESLTQDEDTFDTWFSSGLWPLGTLGWPDHTIDFDSYFPQSVLETGYDILPFWVCRMMMMSWEITGKMPFHTVYLHGMVTDERGRKFSKSLGNGIDPLEVIEKYSADAMRLALTTGSTPGNNVAFSWDKVDYTSRFITKLWNATRFVHTKTIGEGVNVELDYESLRQEIIKNTNKLNDFDKWIVSGLNEIVTNLDHSMVSYQFGDSLTTTLQFVWGSFCDWYIEVTKHLQSPVTDKVLLYGIGTMLKVLHPIIPFATEQLWKNCGFTGWLTISPVAQTIPGVVCPGLTKVLMETISELRNLKTTCGIAPHQFAHTVIKGPTSFEQFAKQYEGLIKSLARLESIEFVGQSEEISSEYQTSVLYELTIGMRSLQQIDWRAHLVKLEEQLKDESRYADELRMAISAPGFKERAPANVVEQKNLKLEQTLAKIESLKLEISKINFTNK